jgi:hypothetical protein
MHIIEEKDRKKTGYPSTVWLSINSLRLRSTYYCLHYPHSQTMATYCLSIHDLRLLLRQKEEIEDCWLLDADTEQLDSGDSERDNTADSCSLDTDSDRIDPDDKMWSRYRSVVSEPKPKGDDNGGSMLQASGSADQEKRRELDSILIERTEETNEFGGRWTND